jgi:hypothetical protein
MCAVNFGFELVCGCQMCAVNFGFELVCGCQNVRGHFWFRAGLRVSNARMSSPALGMNVLLRKSSIKAGKRLPRKRIRYLLRRAVVPLHTATRPPTAGFGGVWAVAAPEPLDAFCEVRVTLNEREMGKKHQANTK